MILYPVLSEYQTINPAEDGLILMWLLPLSLRKGNFFFIIDPEPACK